jgi:hypothetical protein
MNRFVMAAAATVGLSIGLAAPGACRRPVGSHRLLDKLTGSVHYLLGPVDEGPSRTRVAAKL